MDLYEIVGVDKNATKDQIKKAYRKKAAKVHPDVGGDTEKFKELAKAYHIIFDQDKRKRYDEGESAESISQAAKSEDEEITQNLRVLFIQIVLQHDPKHTDIIGILKKHIEKQAPELERLIAVEKTLVERFETAIARLKITEGSENFLAISAKYQIDTFKRKIEAFENQKKIGIGMLKRIEAFSYEFEADPFLQQMQGQGFMHIKWDPQQP
jgi:curved DNA-binding protein CbpA